MFNHGPTAALILVSPLPIGAPAHSRSVRRETLNYLRRGLLNRPKIDFLSTRTGSSPPELVSSSSSPARVCRQSMAKRNCIKPSSNYLFIYKYSILAVLTSSASSTRSPSSRRKAASAMRDRSCSISANNNVIGNGQ